MLSLTFLKIINHLSPNAIGQGVEPIPEEEFQGPSLGLWAFAWIFLIIGILLLGILIIYTKYGRELSIKLSILSIFIASTFLGFSFHFFLLHFGL